MSKTKIVVLRMKEVVYTAVFVGIGVLLLIVLFFMFGRDCGVLSLVGQGDGNAARREAFGLCGGLRSGGI